MIVRRSQLRTLCLIVLLLPLPLLYILHMKINDQQYQPLHDMEETAVENRHPSSPPLPPAAVRRVLLRETRRVHKTLSSQSSIFLARRTCRSRICREYLTKQDLGYFSYCWRKTKMKNEVARSQCKFLNTTSRDPVALASFPGSGNTWVRGLLQKATGICTGGIYCDTKLRLSGYPGESIRSGRTLVVKSHQVDPRWTGVYYPPNTTDRYFTKEIDIPVYDTAILLVRNPFHSLVSEWNRLISINMSVSDNHVNIIATQYFGSNQDWNDFVYSNGVTWQETIVGWLINNHHHRVLVAKYDDLQDNAITEVMRMLDFLGYPYSLSTITKKLRRNYDEFQRSHSNRTSLVLDYFTKSQISFLNSIINNTAHIITAHRLQHVCDVTKFIYHHHLHL